MVKERFIKPSIEDKQAYLEALNRAFGGKNR